MRKELDNTKATVRLRKSAYRKEWYLYIESYPVRVAGKDSPQRVREYLNRTITTPIWDKSRTARTIEANPHPNSDNCIINEEWFKIDKEENYAS